MKDKIWKDVVGYEGLYKVSNLGEIISYHKVTPKLLTPTVATNGYLMVSLSKDGVRKYTTVHRIVAKAFIQNPENKRTVNHINEIKTDNRVENLEWATYKENLNHGTRSLKQGITRDKPVAQYDLQGNFIKKYYSIHEASRQTDGLVPNIHKCCNGIIKTCVGYKWRYADD